MTNSMLKMMARWAATAAVAGLGLMSGAAHANRVSWSVGINVPGPVYGAPQPVYVAPPQPVYYAPPPPVYYAPPPAVVYRPAPVYYGPPRGYYRHDHYRGDRGRGRGHGHGYGHYR